MKTLHLVLKCKWWDMIQSGEKKEEYRDLSDYWVKRLLRINSGRDGALNYLHSLPTSQVWQEYDIVTFHLGYTKTTMTFEIESISVGKGREEWGAEKDKGYFVIKLGKRI